MTLLLMGLAVVLLAGVLTRLLGGRSALAVGIFRWGLPAGCLVGVTGVVTWFLAPAASSTLSGGGAYGLDSLSAWFASLFLGVGATVAVYGSHYLSGEAPQRQVGSAHLLLSVLIVALTGVVTARTVVAFLAAWEIMAISAWLLVIFEREHAEVRRAGLIYLVLTHTSTLALFGMFAAWSGEGAGATFAGLADAAANHRTPVALVLTLALIGFGIKAGAVPGHVWLPGAHAAAPSHVSALLSGVMLKAGVYGLLRVVLLLGSTPAWWGWIVLCLGLMSAVLGVLWALAQHDLKRLLAYHSVENIGIILLGLGLGVLGSAYHQPAIALLGMTGALLHTVNHALFKSLLFFGAGAVVRVTGIRDIDRLGGLARLMPHTATAFLIGSAAIVGLPPLNGFISEWVIFRGLLEAGGAAGGLRTASVAAAGLALTGALALACFTKLHGVLFLGHRRGATPVAPGAERGLVAPQLVLAASCVAIGLLPWLLVPAAARVASAVLQASGSQPDLAGVSAAASRISLAAGALLLLGLLLWGLRRAGRSRPMARVGATWGCGYPLATSHMQYTASSYAAGLLSMYGSLAGSRPVSGPLMLEVAVADPVLDRIGRPVWGRVRHAAQSLRLIQTGRISWYLVYVIAALVGLLIYLWVAAR